MSRQLAKRWISVDEYERMGKAGVFTPDERLELLEGEIYEMSPIGSPHAACVKYLNTLFNQLFSGKMLVCVQDPIRLNDFSEPQPDIALLRWRDDFYRHTHPTPADVWLVIEVADSTVESDRSYKMPLYAKAGIPEAWLVNLVEECVELYAEPESETYQTVRRFTRGEAVTAHGIRDLNISVSDILG
ncbi:MAG TPA: Uma2 family endonuclease [Pyrinomonadaceae bacterium]|nr:Uma2 family endonuclease [Pyrinomonadaceae bacterium]